MWDNNYKKKIQYRIYNPYWAYMCLIHYVAIKILSELYSF